MTFNVCLKSYFVFLISVFPIFIYTQNRPEIEKQIDIKSPDTWAFLKMNYFPINEYTGKLDITIPIYEIKLGSLKIPISLKYNFAGIKVNSISSDVGLGWSLEGISQNIKKLTRR